MSLLILLSKEFGFFYPRALSLLAACAAKDLLHLHSNILEYTVANKTDIYKWTCRIFRDSWKVISDFFFFFFLWKLQMKEGNYNSSVKCGRDRVTSPILISWSYSYRSHSNILRKCEIAGLEKSPSAAKLF